MIRWLVILLLACSLTTATAQQVNISSGSPLAVVNGGTGDTGTAWTSYTPTATCGTSGTITSDTVSGRYKIIGKTMFLEAQINITTLGTCLGNLNLTIGTGTIAANTSLAGANNTAGTSVPVVASATATAIAVLFATAPAANNYWIGGVIELQ